LLERLEGNFRFVVHLKPYALACKLFEYIFEPAFSDCNSYFYGIGFHKFISTLVFVGFRSSDRSTVKLLESFSTFTRKGSVEALASIFSGNKDYRSFKNPLEAIGRFAYLHRHKIEDEVLGFREVGVPNWILDVTTTSLYSLLASWGETYDSLTVTCDQSKPVRGDLPLFNSMVGRKDRATVRFQGRDHSIIFNLKEPLILGSSDQIAGLQLADIIAAAASFTWKCKYDGTPTSESRSWSNLLIPGIQDASIWPDLGDADPRKPAAFANGVILAELLDRSENGEDLCDGIPQMFVQAMKMHKSEN
jgi:hypothetical protein